MYLPFEIQNKIMLFNESREASLIKKYWKDLDECINIYVDLVCFPLFIQDTAGNYVECGYYSEIQELDYPRRSFMPVFEVVY